MRNLGRERKEAGARSLWSWGTEGGCKVFAGHPFRGPTYAQPLSLCGLADTNSKPGRSDLPQPEDALLRRSVVSDSVWPEDALLRHSVVSDSVWPEDAVLRRSVVPDSVWPEDAVLRRSVVSDCVA